MEDIVEVYKPPEHTLQPCPFCGSKEIVFISYKTEFGLRWKVVCLNCIANIDPGWVQEKGYLWELWNRRAVRKEGGK
ncbi:Lar family restriction alleviation protein [Clostridium kluyveri]|uniref:Lar family restriction alleviation protein n=1 Tax=Clostridium kluyveri TaxID=1534 RepID=UPI0012EC8771|nr:Lar family restriction alleviation protein [Clostridium kluyveri]